MLKFSIHILSFYLSYANVSNLLVTFSMCVSMRKHKAQCSVVITCSLPTSRSVFSFLNFNLLKKKTLFSILHAISYFAICHPTPHPLLREGKASYEESTKLSILFCIFLIQPQGIILNSLFSMFFMIYSHVYFTSQMLILSTNLPPFLVLSSLQISVILYMEKGFSPTLYGLYGDGFTMNEFHQL